MDDNKYKVITELLTRRKEQLEQKVSNDNNYKVDNNETIENINASIETLKVDLSNNVTELERLNEELKDQQENIDILIGYPDDISDDLKKYKDEDINFLGVLTKEHEKIITKMVGASKDELVTLREESKKYYKYINEFNNQLYDAKSKVDSIKLRITELQRNNVNINNTISEKNDMLEKIELDNLIDEAEKNEDITKIQETDKKIADLKSLSNPTNETTGLLSDEQISSLSSDISSIEEEIGDKTQKISDLKAKLSNDDNYVPSVFYGMALQADLMDLNNSKKDYDNKISNLISANNVLNNEISNLNSKISKENDMILELEKQKENTRILKFANMDDKDPEANEKYETYVNEENNLINKQNKCRENIQLFNEQIKLKTNEIEVNNQNMKSSIDFVNGLLAKKIASKKEEISKKDSVDYNRKREDIKLLDETRLELSALYDKKNKLKEQENKVSTTNDTKKEMTDLEKRVLSKALKNVKVADMKKVPKSKNPYSDASVPVAGEPSILGQVVAVEEPTKELKSKLKLPKWITVIKTAFVIALIAATAVATGKFNELEEKITNLQKSHTEEISNLTTSNAKVVADLVGSHAIANANTVYEKMNDETLKNSEEIDNAEGEMSIDEAVNGVLKGDFFNGEARIVALKAEGFTDAEIDQIQSKVNAALKGNNINSNVTGLNSNQNSNSSSNGNSGSNVTNPDGGLGAPGGNSGENVTKVPTNPSTPPEVTVNPGSSSNGSVNVGSIVGSHIENDDTEMNDLDELVEEKEEKVEDEMKEPNVVTKEEEFVFPIPSNGGIVFSYDNTIYVINLGGDENIDIIEEIAGDTYETDYSKIAKLKGNQMVTEKDVDYIGKFEQQKTVEDAIEPVPYKVSEGLCYLFNVNGQKLAFNLTEDVTLSVPGYDMNPIDSDYVMNYSRSEISFRDDVTVESEGTLTYEELKAMNNIVDENTLENDLEQTAPEVTPAPETVPETEVTPDETTPETTPEQETVTPQVKPGDTIHSDYFDNVGNETNADGSYIVDTDGNLVDPSTLSLEQMDAINKGETIDPTVASNSNAMKI